MRILKTRFRYFILPLFFLLFSGGVFATELPAPTIGVNPDIYYPLDEILYLEGRAKPNSTLQIHFLKQGEKPLRLVAKSDQNGEWVLAERVPLKAGDWEVRARIVDGEQTSSWSNPRIIKAIITGITLGGVTVKFSFFVLLLVISAGVIIYLFFRLKREAREKTEVQLEQDFSELRHDIIEELKHLERKRPLSQEEREHKDKLLRNLEHTEKEINRKLKDI